MRIPATAWLAAMLIAPAVFSAARAAPTPKFQSTADYMTICGVAHPGDACLDAFVQAGNWVRFNSDTGLCAPDLKTSFGSREYSDAVDGEVNQLIAWLKQNPEGRRLDYVQSLGRGMIALYACK